MTDQIVIPDDFPQAISETPAEAKLRAAGRTRIYQDKAADAAGLIARIKDAEVVVNIRAYSHFTPEVLDACPRLRLISIWGTGTDNVDLTHARSLGITVTNTPGANALSVAEHTVALMLALARQVPVLDRGTRAGEWPRVNMVQLSGKVLGILGTGAIGAHVARMAGGLGMDVIAWTRRPSEERAERLGVRFVDRGGPAADRRCGQSSPGVEREYPRVFQTGRFQPDEAHGVFRQHRAGRADRPGSTGRGLAIPQNRGGGPGRL